MSTRTKWTNQLIEEKLREFVSRLGRMPTFVEMKSVRGLGLKVQRTGGMEYWALRFGMEINKSSGYSHGKRWNEKEIERQLIRLSKEFDNRMPSVHELKNGGMNGLACVVARRGGFRYWAGRLGLELKGTETHFAHKWELNELDFFQSSGFSVEKQRSGCEFDLMVNGNRVDVKCATEGCYRGGYIFAGLKRGIDCDFFDLLCIENNVVKHRLIIPSSEARIVTITITPKTLNGESKYSKFIGAINFLAKRGRYGLEDK